jgi:hypothetical protein
VEKQQRIWVATDYYNGWAAYFFHLTGRATAFYNNACKFIPSRQQRRNPGEQKN